MLKRSDLPILDHRRLRRISVLASLMALLVVVAPLLLLAYAQCPSIVVPPLEVRAILDTVGMLGMVGITGYAVGGTLFYLLCIAFVPEIREYTSRRSFKCGTVDSRRDWIRVAGPKVGRQIASFALMEDIGLFNALLGALLCSTLMLRMLGLI